jgi:hypothetical protein
MEIIMRHVLCSARVLCACTVGILAWGLTGAARAEFYRGEMTGWSESPAMSNDTSFGSIWKVTLTSTNTDSQSLFKFTKDTGSWSPQYGWKSGNATAAKNATVGTLSDNAGGDPGDQTLTNEVSGRRYSFNMDAGHSSYVVMETPGDPVSIASVTDNSATRWTNTVTATIQLSAAPSTQESVWVRFTTNASFSPSHLIPAGGSATNYSATLPATPNGRAYYYVLTSAMPSNVVVSSGFDLATLRGKNAGGSANFSYLLNLGNSWHIPTNAEPSGRLHAQPAHQRRAAFDHRGLLQRHLLRRQRPGRRRAAAPPEGREPAGPRTAWRSTRQRRRATSTGSPRSPATPSPPPTRWSTT